MKKESIKNKVNTKIESGITLIALVVTIIVLLILAGISIQMLTGDNGILKRAAESKEETEIEQIVENARIDIINTQLSKQSGVITDNELEEILTSKYGTLSTEEENIVDKTLTTTDGKYKIPVSRIYDGVFLDDKLARYKNEVDLYFTNKLAEAEINKLKLQEYLSKDYSLIYDYNTGKYKDIDPILDASTELSFIGYEDSLAIMEYRGVLYRITSSYSPSFTISAEPFNREETNVTDIKKIITKIDDNYSNKLLIQNGELVYIPDEVNENEKSTFEKVGIFAMTLTTIVFIVNGDVFAKKYSDKMIIPNEIPIYPTEEYVFDGWYYDEEEKLYSGTDQEVMQDYTDRQVYRASAGQSVEDKKKDGKVIVYATFKTASFRGMCLQEKTKITLADGTKKNIEDVNYDDELLVWNFDEGKLDKAKPIWIMDKQTTKSYIKYKFENGEEINTPGHRIFNYDRQEFTEIEEDIDTPIGTTVFTETQGTTKLIAKYEIEEETNFYNIITNKHINLFSNGILTSLRFNSTYDIENMKFVKDDRVLNKNEDYPNIPKEYFDGLRLAEQKNTRRKNGEIWWKEEVENKILKNKKI